MIIKIFGCKGNSYIHWTCNFLKQQFAKYYPITILYFHPGYYYPIKEQILSFDLEANLTNFYMYFGQYAGIEYYTKDLYKIFWDKVKNINGGIKVNTIVIMDSHSMDKRATQFLKNIVQTQNLILAGDPNFGDYPENWGENYLKDFSGEEIDINKYFSFPQKLHEEIMNLMPKMDLNGVKPYVPQWEPLSSQGELYHINANEYLSYVKGTTGIIKSSTSSVMKELFSKNIAYRILRIGGLLKIPVQLFKYVNTLGAILEENRMLSNTELIRVIKLTRGEIVEKFGGRKFLIQAYSPINIFKPKTIKYSGFFDYLVEQYKRDRLEMCIIPTQRNYYVGWKNNIMNKEWINPNIILCNPKELKCEEFDTVITEETYPLMMWRIIGRSQNRLVYLQRS